MTIKSKTTRYRLQALIDFTHCERGWCINCSVKQRHECEEALNYKGKKVKTL